MTKILQINLPDWVKAIVMAITVPVAGYLLMVVQSGSLNVDWNQIMILAVSGFLGYLIKQMGTSSTVTAVNPSNVPTPVVVTEKTFGIPTSPAPAVTLPPATPSA